MKNNKFNIFNLLAYFLIIILFLIICLNFYKILKHSSEININVSSKKNKNPQKNNLNEVYYNENTLREIPNISKSDIVYQWFDDSINSLSYSSITYDKNISQSSSISFKNSIDVSELPTIKFVDLIKFNKTNFIEGGKNIIFTFPNEEVIKFCFKNDMYYSYETNKDNSIEISPVRFTNIIITKINDYPNDYPNDYIFNNKSKITGEGFVFSNGKYKEVIFKDNLIFDNISNSQVSLLKGNTFWCFLNSDSNIEFFD